jgi:hypothetical protein
MARSLKMKVDANVVGLMALLAVTLAVVAIVAIVFGRSFTGQVAPDKVKIEVPPSISSVSDARPERGEH